METLQALPNDTLFLWANSKRLEWAAKGLWVSIERRASRIPSLDTINDEVVRIVESFLDDFIRFLVADGYLR
jgi:hypothetical protein